ncbi:Copper homeostasis protein cutC [Paramyrothecium foliicola]|nr:Copper homeostasis protein cutC [Paramyrothecium foliicola]
MAPQDPLEPGLLKLEVAVFSGIAALRAQTIGAQRVELNAPGSYREGGLTPPLSELTSVAKSLHIPVRIMIRPRGAPADGSPDFIYTDEELAAMRRAIDEFKGAGILNPFRGDAFVFGVMKLPSPAARARHPEETVTIDVTRCTQLVKHARPFGSIFHRAFDPIAASERWERGIETLIQCGFEGLLTAGGFGSAADNVSHLETMTHRTNNRLQMVVGGGLRSHNVTHPASRLACYPHCSVWLHTAAMTRPVEQDDPNIEILNSNELGTFLKQLGLAKRD